MTARRLANAGEGAGRPHGNTGPFPPWRWVVEPWPWHDIDGVRYCDEHGVYRCRFCETAHLASAYERALELLDLTADLLNQYVGESLYFGKPERAHAPAEALNMIEEFLRDERAATPARPRVEGG